MIKDNKDNFEKELKAATKEYVEKIEGQKEPGPKVEFSECHKKNMEEFFEELERTAVDAEPELKVEVKIKDEKSISFMKYSRVVIVILLLSLAVTMAITPSMTAWRKEQLDMYGDKSGDYAWLLPSDVTDDLEYVYDNYDEYLEYFGYVPEGVEFITFKEKTYFAFVEFNLKTGEKFELKVLKDVNEVMDMEDVELDMKKYFLENSEFSGEIFKFYSDKTEKKTFVWLKDFCRYTLYGEINDYDANLFIKNIKYKNFEKRLK